MSTHQREHPVNDQIAELLLEDRPGPVPDSHPRLAVLLTAAAAPGRPDELSGEQACLVAYRAAQLAAGPVRTHLTRPDRTLS
jgi:hypothetical protein